MIQHEQARKVEVIRCIQFQMLVVKLSQAGSRDLPSIIQPFVVLDEPTRQTACGSR